MTKSKGLRGKVYPPTEVTSLSFCKVCNKGYTTAYCPFCFPNYVPRAEKRKRTKEEYRAMRAASRARVSARKLAILVVGNDDPGAGLTVCGVCGVRTRDHSLTKVCYRG